MAIWPFIISRNSRTELGEVVIYHEKIHFRQQLEMLFFGFFVWYFLEYFFHLARVKNRHEAYRAISFEREAYANESDMNYLRKRSWFAWVRYIK